MGDWIDKARHLGRAMAGDLEAKAEGIARRNKNTPLGQEYEQFTEEMRNVKNPPMLNSRKER
ncbi:MAG: hypothetical protein Q4E24_15595 [bacterium]|nr:hypothetical protein [bacterium]